MRTPPSAQTLPSETSNAVPGPGGTALRALPACALGLIGTPALAAVVPHDGRESLWPTLVIVLMLALMFGVMVLDRRRLPREPTGGDTLRWQTALAFARRHGSVPEREDERLMAARVAYQRIWYALLLWSFLGGFACAVLVTAPGRPAGCGVPGRRAGARGMDVPPGEREHESVHVSELMDHLQELNAKGEESPALTEPSCGQATLP